MNEKTGALPCRSVTQDEISHYHEHGWVKLKRFIDPGYLQTLLDLGREKMGDDADSNGPPRAGFHYYNAESAEGMSHPRVRELILEVGQNAKRLMKRAAPTGVRFYYDLFAPKLPSGHATKHGGNSASAFHQDFISLAVDRSGGMNFWIPLEAYGPESGTISYVSGSHRMGVLGDYRTYGDEGMFSAYPELHDMETSGPMSFELGDIAVHSHLTVHGASLNFTAKPRWTYILIMEPADVYWTGVQVSNLDTSHLTPWQPFDDETLPTIVA